MQDDELRKKKRIIGIITAVLVIVFLGALTYFVGKPLIQFVSEPDKFREWVESYGALGVLIFIGINMVQLFLL